MWQLIIKFGLGLGTPFLYVFLLTKIPAKTKYIPLVVTLTLLAFWCIHLSLFTNWLGD